jgi:acrylyl-CoA reductase (NADPH)
MLNSKFKSLFVIKKNKNFKYEIKDHIINDVGANEVVIKIKFSSLNYKDFLVCTGKYWDARRYPLIPGIDCAGTIAYSKSKKFSVGDKVVIIASPAGSKINGGFSNYIKIDSKWINKIPKGLNEKNVMIYGTAGFTAMHIIQKILTSKVNKKLPILVTGGSGGVGSFSILILKKLGFNVTATTRTLKNKHFLESIGADNIMLNKELRKENGLAMQRKMFSACIDSVGGQNLDFILKRLTDGGNCYTVGFSQSNELVNINLTAFILRGIKLIGIHTESINQYNRKNVWEKISLFNKKNRFPKTIYKEIKFDLLKKTLMKFNVQKRGRFLIKIV